jgi:peptidoglycan/xylan/chitin deacetylase (PgdA/CDA1 family)
MDNGHSRALAAGAGAGAGLIMPLHWLLRQTGKLLGKNKLNILIYHQVLEEADPMRPSEPDAEKFRWHMKLIREYFNPSPLDVAVKQLRIGELPANTVCVTFDDGYLNNLEIAQPILENFGIPATVYIATAFGSGENMWNDRIIDLIGDRSHNSLDLGAVDMGCMEVSDWESRRNLASSLLAALKYRDFRTRNQLVDELYQSNNATEAPRKMMSPDEIVELARRGVDIGAHTVDHPILKTLEFEEQRQQIFDSKTELEQLISLPVTGFAYPNGLPEKDYSSTATEIVEAAGFEYAVSTTWGISTVSTSAYELNRSTPWDNRPDKFHLRLIRQMLQS